MPAPLADIITDDVLQEARLARQLRETIANNQSVGPNSPVNRVSRFTIGASRPVKVALPGPYLLTRTMWLDCVSDKAYPDRESLAADLRLIEIAQLQVDESALTGESVTVAKQTEALAAEDVGALGDRTNMAFKGTTAAHGRGTGLVVATGMATELGKVAGLLDRSGELQTPLQQRLAAFGKRLALVVLAICALIFAIGVLRGESPVLIDMTNDILLHVRGYRQLTIGRTERTAVSLPEHLAIIEALEERDTELAEKRARDHTLGLATYVETHGQEIFT